MFIRIFIIIIIHYWIWWISISISIIQSENSIFCMRLFLKSFNSNQFNSVLFLLFWFFFCFIAYNFRFTYIHKYICLCILKKWLNFYYLQLVLSNFSIVLILILIYLMKNSILNYFSKNVCIKTKRKKQLILIKFHFVFFNSVIFKNIQSNNFQLFSFLRNKIKSLTILYIILQNRDATSFMTIFIFYPLRKKKKKTLIIYKIMLMLNIFENCM